jgi:hypothetical protein
MNPETKREYDRRRYAANPEKYKAARRQRYRDAHPETASRK